MWRFCSKNEFQLSKNCFSNKLKKQKRVLEKFFYVFYNQRKITTNAVKSFKQEAFTIWSKTLKKKVPSHHHHHHHQNKI